jgi:PKD domain-containing protein
MLVCATSGTIRYVVKDGVIHNCPALASYAAAPATAEIGDTVQLSSTAFAFESDPLFFTWTASSGVLGSLTTAVSSYTCVEVGAHAVTVEVSDGTCSDTASVEVTCTSSRSQSQSQSGDASDAGVGAETM